MRKIGAVGWWSVCGYHFLARIYRTRYTRLLAEGAVWYAKVNFSKRQNLSVAQWSSLKVGVVHDIYPVAAPTCICQQPDTWKSLVSAQDPAYEVTREALKIWLLAGPKLLASKIGMAACMLTKRCAGWFMKYDTSECVALKA